MNRNKIFILISGIINIMVGISSITSSGFYGLILLILGFLTLLLGMEEKTIARNKTLLNVVGIISTFIMLPSGILLLLAVSEVKPDIMKQEEIVDPESKKIDTLLKLGVGMVFISGILFATTSWELITLPIKLLVLVILAMLFLGLSIFTEQKLNIKKTSIMYYILSMSFFFSVGIGICFYGLLGPEVTYVGARSDVAYAITYFYLSVLTAISYVKYNSEGLIYLTYTAILLGLNYFLSAIGLTDTTKLLILSTATFGLNVLIPKDNSLSKFSTVTSYIYPLLLVKASFDQELLCLTLASIINVLNTTLLGMKNKDRVFAIGSIITNYLLIIFTVGAYESEYSPIIMVSLSLIQTIIIRFKILIDDDAINKLSQVTNAVFTVILFIIAMGLQDFQTVLIGCLYLLMNLLGELDSKDRKKSYMNDLLRPIGLFLTVTGMCHFGNIQMSYIPYSYALVFLLILYAILHKLSYLEAKAGYFVASIVVLVLEVFVNSADSNGLIQLLSALPIGYLFMNSIPEENQGKTVILYIALLSDIFLAIVCFNTYNSIDLINPLIAMVIYLILNYIFKDEPKLKMVGDFAILAPLICEVNQLLDYGNMKMVCMNIIQLYGLYLIIKYFFKKGQSERSSIIIIGLILILAQVIFTTDLVVAIYVGLVGIMLIAIGYNRDDLPVLFKSGIIVTILNIAFQLRALWVQVPFYLYLLLGGLAIIGFVTYKEINKK